MEPDIKIEYLDWDSRFFGFKIGRLELQSTCIITEHQVGNWRSEGYTCLYIDSATEVEISNRSSATLNPMSSRCLLQRETRAPQLNPEVKILTQVTDGIIELGIHAGKHSRFMCDDHFNKKKTTALYAMWIRESLHGKMGDEIYFIGTEINPLGLIAFTNKKSHMQIGLLAVAPGMRNQGIAKKLLTASDHFANAYQLPFMNLYTQGNNIAAQHLFAQDGFTQISSINQFHLWM